MQEIQMQYDAMPQGARQEYVECQDYAGNGYHSQQSNYCCQGGCRAKHNGNWHKVHGC